MTDDRRKIRAASKRMWTVLHRYRITSSAAIRDMLPEMVAAFRLARLEGDQAVSAGIDQLARWGKCSDRQARRHMRTLEAEGLVIDLENASGGHRKPLRWKIDEQRLGEWLQEQLLTRCADDRDAWHDWSQYG